MGAWVDELAKLRRDHYATECHALGSALVGRILSGQIPPDDAYAWTRIVCELARKSAPRPVATESATAC